ncbi:MAG: alanine racemase [Candidatus Omnitrophica bacterium]|nr:alanine racemase [Candidatus Omnitrophota bacterium]
MILRPTWTEINLDAIRYNFSRVKEIVGLHTGIMGVVKADAYGHGAVSVAKLLEQLEAAYLGVSSLDEALELRQAGIRAPILILGSVLPDLHAISGDPVLSSVTFTLCTLDVARILQKEANKQQRPFRIHVKVDTGMGRLGVWYEQAAKWVKNLAEFDALQLEGIYTHFANMDERDLNATLEQVGRFTWLLEMLEVQEVVTRYRHAANSLAVIRLPASHFSMVRPGIILYGVWPALEPLADSEQISLMPALSLKTRVVFLKHTPAGRSLGYGGTYTTKRPTRIATLPIGYGDGYPAALSNKAKVLIRGMQAPVVGRISMDQTLVDVGHIAGVQVGDEVVLVGTQGEQRISIEETSRLAGRIPYELLCGITGRVPRVYHNTAVLSRGAINCAPAS